MSRRSKLVGHLWTVGPHVRYDMVGGRRPKGKPWAATLLDPSVGEVAISGLVHHVQGADTLVVLVHGLGGSVDSGYCIEAARAAHAAGYSTLRMAMRGADRSGEDMHHAGLTADIHAALASPDARSYERIIIIGFSLGGHHALWLSTEDVDPRVTAVAAICPPVDLKAGGRFIDDVRRTVYREHVLMGLNEIYAAIDARGRAPTPLRRVKQARTIREWDSLVVVPRFGFDNVDDYYAKASFSSVAEQSRVPTLVVASRYDPMIPAASIQSGLRGAPSSLSVRWVDGGGHVYFSPRLDLSYGRKRGLIPQVLGWANSVS